MRAQVAARMQREVYHLNRDWLSLTFIAFRLYIAPISRLHDGANGALDHCDSMDEPTPRPPTKLRNHTSLLLR